jgi:hypothetical protein
MLLLSTYMARLRGSSNSESHWLLGVTVLSGRLLGAGSSWRPGSSLPRHGATSSAGLFTKAEDAYRCVGLWPGLPTATHSLFQYLTSESGFDNQRQRSGFSPLLPVSILDPLGHCSATVQPCSGKETPILLKFFLVSHSPLRQMPGSGP